MPRRLIKRYYPDLHKVREHKSLQVFGTLLHSPNLWHLNRRSVAGAFAVGLFVAFIPIPGQMVLAAAVAIVSQVNLPIAVVLVWVTNPITMPPLFYGAYKLGQWVLGGVPSKFHFEPSVRWLTTELLAVWEPFLLGCLLVGLGAAIVGYIAVRLFWRYYVLRRWESRLKGRSEQRNN